MATVTGTKVVTGKVRFSYAHVFTPHAMNEGDKPKYSVSIIISKKDKSTIEAIKEAIEEAKKMWGERVGGPLPKALKQPLRDGDVEKEGEEYVDSYFVNASTTRKPEIIDDNGHGIASQDDFYSGCYGKASLNFYPYKVKSAGIACGLNNLLKLEDGDRLGGGGSSAAADFGFDEDDANGDFM